MRRIGIMEGPKFNHKDAFAMQHEDGRLPQRVCKDFTRQALSKTSLPRYCNSTQAASLVSGNGRI
jgi:hypothetical protein